MIRKLLLVEDDEDYRNLLEMKLKAVGYDVLVAGNGLEALEQIAKNDIRLMVTDWAMPKMSGLDLIKRLKITSENPYIYVIVLSAFSTIKDIVKGIDVGADDYLTKPFSFVELEARIKIGERILNLETKLQKSLAEQTKMASHDFLTGIYNRRHCYALGAQLFEQGRRYDHRLAAILIDIDRFKNVNDANGHDIGDEVLTLVTKRITKAIRNVDILGRHGGEEFLILMPETTSKGAVHVAERIRQAISGVPLKTYGPTISLTISLGVAIQETATPDLTALIKRADVALYKSKNAGRNRVSV